MRTGALVVIARVWFAHARGVRTLLFNESLNCIDEAISRLLLFPLHYYDTTAAESSSFAPIVIINYHRETNDTLMLKI